MRVLNVGRNQYVEYAELGDPAGYPAVFFHGFVGSVHQAAAAHQAAQKAGLRIVAPHRPGVGASTQVVGDSIACATQPILDLLSTLGIEKYAAIGVSGGAPYAVACCLFDASRISSLSLVSPLGPLSEQSIRSQFRLPLRLLLQLSRMGSAGRSLTALLLAYKQRVFEADMRSQVLKFVARVSPADLEFFRRNTGCSLDMFVRDHEVIFATPNTVSNLIQEMQRYWDWGFDARSVAPSLRTHIWHGTHDTMVPLSSAQFMRQCIPQAQITLAPGGHFASLTCLDDIVQFALGRA